MGRQPQKLTNYIGGQAKAPKSGKYLDNYAPATGEIYSLVPDSNAEDVNEAVAAAKEIFPWWSKRTPEQRSQVLLSIADRMEKSLDELARAESMDQGKPYHLAREAEIPRSIQNFRYFATKILHTEEMAKPNHTQGTLNYTHRTPVGVAGLISPWNLPLLLLTWKIAPALAAGNTVVCKPSELTPMTAYLMGEIFNEAGLPHGVVNIVFGTGAGAGAALTQHPDVPLLSFTGGTSTGRRILEASIPRFKKTSLELGGKNAALVFADCDLAEAAITSVRSAFQNQGEICLCNSRIFVEESVYETFVEKFSRAASLIRVGNPLEKEVQMGPLVSKEHREKVMGYIELARKEGGTILTGGDVPSLEKPFDKGYFLNPTVITGLGPQCRVMKEEIFGPVVTIAPFKTEEEAIALANGTEYGLSGSVWSGNTSRAHRVAQALDVGTVWVNSWMLRDLAVPFGGMKHSGLGREGGEHSLEFFTETKNICVKI
ncbi:MAG TPA: aldehyde dehydrogenase [Bdellovibrionota bacterium]|jgi:aminomuconate-semialdehyde/2-hydroxymuconate-6-semialdehyde dehydrogenase